MGKAEVLALLRDGTYVSGEEISRILGVSRAAVWKNVRALREEGFQIDSVPNRGYCLLHRGRRAAEIKAQMHCPWRLTVLDETDSTNNELKRDCNAPHGSVVVAGKQTGGRGRLGRQFASPPGGVYLSVLLRPKALPEELLHLAPMAAVAVRRAIMDCCGVETDIKWTNDLIYAGKKLCGILTELTTEDGVLQSVIIGAGVNCNTTGFPPEVRPTAISLREITKKPIDPNRLAAAMIRRFYEMDAELFTQRKAWLREFEAACITLGKPVQVVRGAKRRAAFAEGIDEYGGLRVRWEDGSVEVIAAGEVSVRGMYGYV